MCFIKTMLVFPRVSKFGLSFQTLPTFPALLPKTVSFLHWPRVLTVIKHIARPILPCFHKITIRVLSLFSNLSLSSSCNYVIYIYASFYSLLLVAACHANDQQGLLRKEVSEPLAAQSLRWTPTPEQLLILEELYRQGTRTPTAQQIQQIAAQLGRFGKIEGKNVFYWFQNHKARERQKLRCRSSMRLSHSVSKERRRQYSGTKCLEIGKESAAGTYQNTYTI